MRRAGIQRAHVRIRRVLSTVGVVGVQHAGRRERDVPTITRDHRRFRRRGRGAVSPRRATRELHRAGLHVLDVEPVARRARNEVARVGLELDVAPVGADRRRVAERADRRLPTRRGHVHLRERPGRAIEPIHVLRAVLITGQQHIVRRAEHHEAAIRGQRVHPDRRAADAVERQRAEAGGPIDQHRRGHRQRRAPRQRARAAAPPSTPNVVSIRPWYRIGHSSRFTESLDV